MKNKLKGKLLKNLLVTTDKWFMAPNGQEYKYIYGNAHFRTTENILGFNPEKSTNWILDFGDVIIMGCQIHYISICKNELKKEIVRVYRSEQISTILN